MKTLSAIVSVVLFPFGVFNALGGLAAGIWLAILGEWWAIGFGVLVIVLSQPILRSAVRLGGLFPILSWRCAERENRKGAILFGFLTSLYVVGVVTAWCVAMLWFFVSMAHPNAAIPMTIWSYGAAILPVLWMAASERDASGEMSPATITATMLAALAYIVVMLVWFVGTPRLSKMIVLFAGIMCGGLLLYFAVIAWALRKDSARQT